MKEYIFVYGQFRDLAKGLLQEPIKCGKASILGKIYQVNPAYPGFVEDGDEKVFGDVYLIDPVILPSLDEYEGEEYDRVKITTTTDVECWVYKYKYDIKGFRHIECGDWWLR